MQALLLSHYGALTNSIAVGQCAEPTLASTDVLIDVHAASINPIDYKIAQGALRPIQKLKLPAILGFDVSGVVRAVGDRVHGFKIGDAVFGRSDRNRLGTFAERACLDESWLALKPDSTTHLEAASLPLVALTTMQALHDRARALPGQHILIHAGAGGVGTFAIQYAKTLGLQVTTTTSSRNAEFVASLGADEVVLYDREDYLQRPDRYDIVFDTLGLHYTIDAFKIIKPAGTVVSIAGPPDRAFPQQVAAGLLLRMAMKAMSLRVLSTANRAGAAYYRFLTESKGSQLTEIAAMIDAGKIKPIIDKVFPFAEIVSAIIYAAQGRSRGKVVVQMK